jgi:Ni,Fe-hydrogenase III small subunit
MIDTLKIWLHQGKQYIPDVTAVNLPDTFSNGRPIISETISGDEAKLVAALCPTEAINPNPFSIDLGKCVFCNECSRAIGKDKIKFTNDYKTATNIRERLIIRSGHNEPINLDANSVRSEIHQYFGSSLKLRQISAGGDNSAEWELNATGNVNFDIGRWGIDFVASPRHADGIVITGPLSENMAEAVQICYDAVPNPKIIILVGTDAISGGIFAGSKALNRDFLHKYPIDLYVPGNPPHPLTFINGVLELIKKRK